MSTIMYDSIFVSTVPPNPPAVAGYTAGFWPDYPALVAAFPHSKILSIAIAAGYDAECLDIESGDAVPSEAPAWVQRQKARGVTLPVLYTSASNVQGLVNLMASSGFPRASYRLWSAHYTYTPHVCGPGHCIYPQADATQWTDTALGRNLDQSECLDTFWANPAPTPPVVVWQPKDEAYWCKCWDTQKMSAARRLRFRTVMAARCARIWLLAHLKRPVDWKFRNRGSRFHALWSRLNPPKVK